MHKNRTAPSIAVALCCTVALAGGALDQETAARGLKEALEVAASRSVEFLGRVDGFLENPDVRIEPPEKMERVAKTLRRIGLDRMVDDFELGMNRAAEAAAPLAMDVFRAVVRNMTFRDALRIVRGDDHEATDYLREHAGDELSRRFLPIVSRQLEEVGATRSFEALMDRVAELPFVEEPVIELDEYVTEEALDGLFLILAREEARIREDPLARTSDLLKTVFGAGNDKGKKVPWWKRLFDDGR